MAAAGGDRGSVRRAPVPVGVVSSTTAEQLRLDSALVCDGDRRVDHDDRLRVARRRAGVAARDRAWARIARRVHRSGARRRRSRVAAHDSRRAATGRRDDDGRPVAAARARARRRARGHELRPAVDGLRSRGARAAWRGDPQRFRSLRADLAGSDGTRAQSSRALGGCVADSARLSYSRPRTRARSGPGYTSRSSAASRCSRSR